jgi:ribonuclease HI
MRKTGKSEVPMANWTQKDILEADHPTLSIQVSSGKKVPAWIEDAIKQADTLASGGDKVPVVVLHQDSTRDEDALVVMKLRDFAGGSVERQKPEPEHRYKSISKQEVNIWTEGEHQLISGKGAWAAVICDGPKSKEMWGTEPEATSKQMQLRAAIEALKALEEPRRISLHSDHPKIVWACEEGWVYEWERKSWKIAKDWPIEKALWNELLALASRHQVK